jgi:hypothetical protein
MAHFDKEPITKCFNFSLKKSRAGRIDHEVLGRGFEPVIEQDVQDTRRRPGSGLRRQGQRFWVRKLSSSEPVPA